MWEEDTTMQDETQNQGVDPYASIDPGVAENLRQTRLQIYCGGSVAQAEKGFDAMEQGKCLAER